MNNMIVIDWFALWNRSVHSLHSPHEQPLNNVSTLDGELAEMSYRAVRNLFVILQEFKPDAVCIALDERSMNYESNGKPGYWRNGYLKRWYQENVSYFDIAGDFYCEINRDFFKWTGEFWDQLTKATVNTTLKQNADEDQRKGLDYGAILSGKWETWTYAELNDENRAIADRIPVGYKFSRSKKPWKFKNDKARVMQTGFKVGERVAALCGENSNVVKFPGAEADDVAAVICAIVPEDLWEITLVTLDSDWMQLVASRKNTGVYLLDKHTFTKLDHSPETNKELVHEMSKDMKVKLIAGDRSDDIPGTWLKNGKQRISKDKALKEVEVAEFSYNDYRKKLDPAAITRNETLIILAKSFIPEEIWNGIVEVASRKNVEYPSKWTWESFGISKHYQDILTEKNIFDQFQNDWRMPENATPAS